MVGGGGVQLLPEPTTVENRVHICLRLADRSCDGEIDAVTFSIWTGTHLGEFLGIPATGRSVQVEAWTLDRYRDGQMTESRIIMDVAGLLTQLGAIPAPAAG